jgi:rubredoxin
MDLAGFDANALAGLLADPPEPMPPEDFTAVDENLPTDFVCPRCKYAWSGKPA